MVEQKIDFKMYILCLDTETLNALTRLNLGNAILIDLEMVEEFSSELLTVKGNRTTVEYYWTLTPVLPLYILNKHPDIDHIIYADADLCFFNSPLALFEELNQNSVLIIPHRLRGKDKHYETKWGKYNVGLILFRNDLKARAVLNWWKSKCIEWCYYRIEHNRAGDQKYLDRFSQLFDGVIPSKNHGAGPGGWNVHYYKYSNDKQNIVILPHHAPLIFFHFNKVIIFNERLIGDSSCYNCQHNGIIFKRYARFLMLASIKLARASVNIEYNEKVNIKTFVRLAINQRFYWARK